jgi:bifunctional DNA-binding transcriptional regulator/antitoxin component of YhaV-PrlF toxin-antitoxin module
MTLTGAENVQTYEIQLDADGKLALPVELRAALGMNEGDIVTLVTSGQSVSLIPTRLIVPEVAERITQIMKEEGVTLDDLLNDLDEQKEFLFQERYGHLLSE